MRVSLFICFYLLFFGLISNPCCGQAKISYPLGFEGFCPIEAHRAVTDGNPETKPFTAEGRGRQEFSILYDETVYLFASLENKKLFKADPVKYAPAYKGLCIPCLIDNNFRVYGNTRHYAFHPSNEQNGRFFLFTNDEKKTVFTINKPAYEKRDIANAPIESEDSCRTMFRGKVFHFETPADREAFLTDPMIHSERVLSEQKK